MINNPVSIVKKQQPLANSFAFCIVRFVFYTLRPVFFTYRSRCRHWRFVLLLLIAGSPVAGNNLPPEVLSDAIESQSVLPGHILFKLTVEAADKGEGPDKIPALLSAAVHAKTTTPPVRVFPHHDPPDKEYHPSGRPLSDLSRIYEVVIDDHELLFETMNAIAATGLVEYVQPRYLPEPLIVSEKKSGSEYIPNDPMIHEQYYLTNIDAFRAWNISRSDTNTVIGIVDTGVELHHPDLTDAIKYNYDDPINGEDSDGDGYVDNFYGWDLGEGNNDPSYNKRGHGVHVSGIAAATADNDEGIAGVGFLSKFLPVKIDDELGVLTKAYEGIVYAADQGVSVINCSWGSHFNSGPFGQDIIDYAVLNKDVVVVAAAGNADTSQPFYPASFNHVVSVAATDSLDRKTSFSSYGAYVDLCAPGIRILSTWINESYLVSAGTSMAAPIVAGAAAILRSHFPEKDALQIGAMLKTTADAIDDVEGNEDYKGQLGHGRVNLYRALTESHWPYVRIMNHLTDEDTYATVRPGDSFSLNMQFQNLLSPAHHVKAVLTTTSEKLEIYTDTIYLGSMDNFEVLDNTENPFIAKALPDLPESHEALFTVSFYDEALQKVGKHSFWRTLNRDYVNVRAGSIATTISARGAIGFNYPYFSQGKGLTYNDGYTVISCGGLLLANSVHEVADNIYGATPGSFSEMLVPEVLPEVFADHPLAPVKVAGRIRDWSADHPGPLNVGIDYSVFFWDADPAEDFFILQYHIVNHSETHYQDLFAGFFADWILLDRKNHRAGIDIPYRLAYSFSADGGHYAAIQMLSEGGMRHYAFDKQGAGGSMRIDNGFSDFKKYTALTSNRLHAGYTVADNNIASLLSSGPHSLPPGDTLEVAFAMHLADNFQDMLENAGKAKNYYNALGDIETHVPSLTDTSCPQPMKAFPNPFTSQIKVELCGEIRSPHTLTLYDVHGRPVKKFKVSPPLSEFNNLVLSVESLQHGIYILRLHGPDKDAALRVMKW